MGSFCGVLNHGRNEKITIDVPVETLEATLADGGGLAETVRQALKEFAHRRACERLREMRGKLDLRLDLEELREDREW